jgi:hypothetical protein
MLLRHAARGAPSSGRVGISGGGGGSSAFECHLAQPHHSYLWQHVVKGRPLLPGAAMFEAAAAAAAAAAAEDSEGGRCALVSAAIAAPLLLGTPSGGGAVLTVVVQHGGGAVTLGSVAAAAGGGGSRGGSTRHLAAIVCQLAKLPSGRALGAAAQPFSAAAWLRWRQQGAAASSREVWAGEAVGSITQQPLVAAPSDGYSCHPAAADAATHFGAAFDVGGGGRVPRVPLALGAYLSHGGASSVDSCESGDGGSSSCSSAAAASTARLLPDGSRVSSFGIARVLTLSSLQSKPLGAGRIVGGPTAHAFSAQTAFTAAAELAASCCTYASVWQAAGVLQPAGNATIGQPSWHRGQLLRVQAGPHSSAVAAGSGGGASLPQAALLCFAATLRALRTFAPGQQQRLAAIAHPAAAQQGAPLAFPCSNGGGRPGLAAAGAAAAGGLLRVAALEEPAWKLELAFADPAAGPLNKAWPSAAAAACDAYGVAAASSASFMPRMHLTVRQPVDATGSHQKNADETLRGGCHAISGGMGGLGLLTACHLAQQAQQAQQSLSTSLLLLGRTGRFAASQAAAAPLLASLLHGGCVVALLAADVAAAEGAAALSRRLLRSCLAPASLIHAAGLLADRLLPGQSLPAARAVMAPKLAGLSAALASLAGQPPGQLILFSSISAALGNAGQANYAAANAALDAAAQALQQRGCAGVSLQWGPWAGAGMAAAEAALLLRLRKQGGLGC